MFEADSQKRRRQEDLSFKIIGLPSAGTTGGPKEEGCPSHHPPPPFYYIPGAGEPTPCASSIPGSVVNHFELCAVSSVIALRTGLRSEDGAL